MSEKTSSSLYKVSGLAEHCTTRTRRAVSRTWINVLATAASVAETEETESYERQGCWSRDRGTRADF